MVQFEEHKVQYGDRHIAYIAKGSKSAPLLIFIHGWPGIGKTWKYQLDAFAALGFRVIAPDMPGYGGSTARKVQSDYAQQEVIQGLLAVLKDTGRDEAIWIAHDWGCGSLWTLANTHPQVCKAVAALCVPYATIELGLEETIKLVDRDLYPEDEYPYGQFDYMVFYEQSFEKATEFFEKDIRGLLKVMLRPGNSQGIEKPALLANVTKAGGWFGGIEKPPPASATPDDLMILEPEVFEELVTAMEKTGFTPADSYYMNHKANREYNLQNSKHEGKLKMPVLFINARYDTVCLTVGTRLGDNMRRDCEKLTETVIEAGHWVSAEKPKEVNAAIARWLVEEVTDWWPGYWHSGNVRHKI